MDRIKKVSFVIPCYRSEHTLPHVVTEIREKMQELTQYTYDIFLVNDASPDNTMETIRDLCEKYDNIKGIGFARNFGQHAALMAGLRHSDGDYVVCLDDDGQTPADEVDKLLSEQQSQYCVPLHRRSLSMVSWVFCGDIFRHIRAWRRPPYHRFWSRSPMR